MAPVTRQSAGQASDFGEQQVPDVTAILNEEAASTSQTSPSKRKRTPRASENVESSPAKRGRGDVPSTVAQESTHPTDSPRRQSGRLKTRASLSAPTPIDRRNIFEIIIPNETAPTSSPAMGPIKKLRTLNKTKAQTASPFKGRGVLETRSTAMVNLDDSPKKRLIGQRFHNISKSLQKAGRAAGRANPKAAAMGGEDTGEDDIFAAARREEAPEPREDTSANNKIPAKAPKQYPSPIQRAKPRQNESAQDEVESSGQSQPPRRSNPIAQAVDQIIDEQDELAVSADNAQGGQEQAEATGDVDNGVASPPRSPAERPQTEAARQAAEQARAEAEARHQKRIEEALRGIEEVAQLHDCEDDWRDALVAAAEIVENRASKKPASTNGKAVKRTMEALVETYERLAKDHPESPGPLNVIPEENLRLLKARCRHICGYRYKPDMARDGERKRMVRDLYEHLIPGSLFLVKWALKARYREHHLSIAHHEEICRLLKITHDMVTSASRWKPRPTLENAVKATTKSDIGPKVVSIMGRYQDAVAKSWRTTFVESLALKQKADLERLNSEWEARRNAVMAKHREYQKLSTPPLSSDAASQIMDINELDTGEEPAVGYEDDEASMQIQGSVPPTRPSIRRVPTEEIPAPTPVEWTDSETVALLNGLQKYRTETRFQDILDAYGGPGGSLEEYDLDQLMMQARWLKQSMAGPLQDRLDKSWDWLRTVPD